MIFPAAADGFEAALKTLAPEDRVRFAVHEVARRETLAMIAKQYGTSSAVISKINDLKGGKVTVGESLKIPEVSGELPDKVLLAASRVDRPDLRSLEDTRRSIVQNSFKRRTGRSKPLMPNGPGTRPWSRF